MKTLNYTDNSGIVWEIEIHYTTIKDAENSFNETIILRNNNNFAIAFKYPKKIIGFDFSIVPSLYDENGNAISYGSLMFGDEIVTSLDPNN